MERGPYKQAPRAADRTTRVPQEATVTLGKDCSVVHSSGCCSGISRLTDAQPQRITSGNSHILSISSKAYHQTWSEPFIFLLLTSFEYLEPTCVYFAEQCLSTATVRQPHRGPPQDHRTQTNCLKASNSKSLIFKSNYPTKCLIFKSQIVRTSSMSSIVGSIVLLVHVVQGIVGTCNSHGLHVIPDHAFNYQVPTTRPRV